MREIFRRLIQLEDARHKYQSPPEAPPGWRWVGNGLLVPMPCTKEEWLAGCV